jgi:lysozyme
LPGALKGVDVSSNNHPDNKAIDWEEVYKGGYVFAIVKITQGTGYVNPWGGRDLDDARAAGLFVGAYHYFEPTAPPAEQASHFVGALMGQRLDLGAWLDMEPGPAEPYTVSGYISGFLLAAEDGRPGCGVYCDLSLFEALKGINMPPKRLWLADWTEDLPKVGQLLWQSGIGEVPGIPGPVDIDQCANARGLNLPSSPAPRPSAATTRPVVLAEEPDADDAELLPEEQPTPVEPPAPPG